MQPTIEQSFIAQAAKTSISHGLTPQIPKELVSETLYQFFKPLKGSETPQKKSSSYQEQTAQKADALVQLHADTNNALANLGLSQSYAPLPGIRKAGRRLGSRDIVRRKRGFSKKAEPTAAVKLAIGNEITQRQLETGDSLYSIVKDLSNKYGRSVPFLRKVRKESVKRRLEEFVARRGLGHSSLRRQGSHLAENKHVSKSEGKRLPGKRGYLGRIDHHREIWLATKRWAQVEEANGHNISQSDLLRDFLSRLKAAIQAAESIECKSHQLQTQLTAWQQKQNSMQTNRKAKEKFMQTLMNRCELSQRSCQRATNLSAEEERRRVVFGWRFFDQALADAASQDPDRIQVKDSQAFISRASETAIIMSDQIPVWLKVDPGKLLTSRLRLKLASEQRKMRRENKKNKVIETEALVASHAKITTVRKSSGKPPRWRVSFVARQVVERYFDADADPVGRILPSILIVPGTRCIITFCHAHKRKPFLRAYFFHLLIKTLLIR